MNCELWFSLILSFRCPWSHPGSKHSKEPTHIVWRKQEGNTRRDAVVSRPSWEVPRVLCREALTGRCYWEVEWSTSSGMVDVGVSYKCLERKGSGATCMLGCYDLSWSLHCLHLPLRLPLTFCAKHNMMTIEYPGPTGCPKLGVFLDWPAGTLSYYKVSSHKLSHTFRTKFSEPVYPGFIFEAW